MTERAFLLAGNGSYSNRGCEAIVRATTALLRQEFGTCRFYSAYFCERGCRDALNEIDAGIVHRPLPAIERFNKLWFRRQLSKVLPMLRVGTERWRHLRPLVEECEAVLMLGGDNYTLGKSRPDEHFLLNRVVRELGKPVILWGASVGPFSRDPAYEAWAAGELRKVSLICARETVTQAYLKSIGVEHNVQLVADPAFLLEPSPAQVPRDVQDALERGCIGLNLSPLVGRYRHGSSVGRWISEAARIVISILEATELPVLLIPHVISVTGRLTLMGDDVFLRNVARLVRAAPGRLLLLGSDYNAAETKWVISGLRAFAGARTHSTIAALSSGVPTIFIGYSSKAQGIALDIYGHTRWLLSVRELEGLVLAERLVEILREEHRVRQQLADVLPEMRRRAAGAARYLKDLLRAQ